MQTSACVSFRTWGCECPQKTWHGWLYWRVRKCPTIYINSWGHQTAPIAWQQYGKYQKRHHQKKHPANPVVTCPPGIKGKYLSQWQHTSQAHNFVPFGPSYNCEQSNIYHSKYKDMSAVSSWLRPPRDNGIYVHSSTLDNVCTRAADKRIYDWVTKCL